MKFHDLDAEFISATTMKYQKAMGQLEKGLPPNGVLPVLKEKIDGMREKITVIADLRNDALKVRHLPQIAPVIGYDYTMTAATLAVRSRVLIIPLYSNQTESFLQPRHWEIIENIIGHHFTPEEPMTLGLLIELEAFKHTEAIQEVSGQASSEASLEAILKKVRYILRSIVHVLVRMCDSLDHSCVS